MWSLLSWLYGVANRVYAVFSSLYYKIRNAALNAWSWAQNAKNRAISWAANTIIYYYNKAKAWVNTYIKPIAQAAWNKAVEVAGNISAWIADTLAKAKRWVDELKVKARSWVDAAIHDFLVWIGIEKADRKRSIDSLEAQFRADMRVTRGSLADLGAKMAPYTEPSTLSLIEQIKTTWGVLSTIIDNPLEWLVAYVGSFLLTLLEYKVAYALGTEKAVLPPPPDWNGGGAGGPLPRGPGPPPGASPLAPPLDYLRISGYRFGPGHWATDFGCTSNMQVYACHGGTIKVAGWSNVGYGNYVVVGNGEWWTLYAHLSQLFVRVGQRVSMRSPIGICGCVGNSTCNHLHLEIKHYGQYLDPVMVFGLRG